MNDLKVVGGHDFIRRAMAETGCSESTALTAVRLIVRRLRPQRDRLHNYLARFSPADRARWVADARWRDPDRVIGVLADTVGIDHASLSDVDDHQAAGRARMLASLAFARAERERVGGLELLDAELERLRASSEAAARVIASIDSAITCGDGR